MLFLLSLSNFFLSASQLFDSSHHIPRTTSLLFLPKNCYVSKNTWCEQLSFKFFFASAALTAEKKRVCLDHLVWTVPPPPPPLPFACPLSSFFLPPPPSNSFVVGSSSPRGAQKKEREREVPSWNPIYELQLFSGEKKGKSWTLLPLFQIGLFKLGSLILTAQYNPACIDSFLSFIFETDSRTGCFCSTTVLVKSNEGWWGGNKAAVSTGGRGGREGRNKD